MNLTDATPTIGDPNGEKLMWTKLGNLPIRMLRLVPRRQDSPDAIVLVLEWFLGDEMVQNDVHVLKLTGLITGLDAGSFT